jgi:pimeloyl-ACP methyl ester carboxylesterase
MHRLVILFSLTIALALPGATTFGAGNQGDKAKQARQERGTLYLTLRDKTGRHSPRNYYGEARGTLSAGFCHIAKMNLDLLSPVAEVVPFYVPEEILRVERIREMPVSDVLDRLFESTQTSSPLLYTHGFYIDFEKGCRRATVFQENARLQGRFLWFSWPSDGDLLNYTHDEADLSWSIPEFADAIIEMEARFGPGGFHLAGHSLGGRGVILALYEVANRDPGFRLCNLVLLAPDIDFDLFRKLLPRIRPLAQRITLYVAEADRPLALSAQVHGYPRLGEAGNDTSLIPEVDVIDVSDLPVRSPTGHLYHVYNKEVGADLNQLLNENRLPEDRHNMRRVGPNLWRLQPD